MREHSRSFFRLSAAERRLAGVLLVGALTAAGVGAGFVIGTVRASRHFLAPSVLRTLKIDRSLDQQTVIRPSRIPGAGNGLFAAVPIARGQVIGHLGGRLVSAKDYPADQSYVAAIPECAWPETSPASYLDARDEFAPGHVSKINFAPARINGRETGFQNADLRGLCTWPYVHFVATRDISAGEEIFASYGSKYPYDEFMQIPAVRNFFCGLIEVDCRNGYTFAAD
jgi:SET domain-containing protein